MMSVGRMMSRMMMAEQLTLMLYLVSGMSSPMVIPIAMRERGMAVWPIQSMLVSKAVGMLVFRLVTLRSIPRSTATTGALSMSFGLNESLPVKIMIPMLKMANSTPRLNRNMVARSSVSA